MNIFLLGFPLIFSTILYIAVAAPLFLLNPCWFGKNPSSHIIYIRSVNDLLIILLGKSGAPIGLHLIPSAFRM